MYVFVVFVFMYCDLRVTVLLVLYNKLYHKIIDD